MIFIGYNHENYIISIISCKNKENANAYWQGRDISPHIVKEFDLSEDKENEKLGFVTPLLCTKEVEAYEFNNMRGRDRKFILVSKS